MSRCFTVRIFVSECRCSIGVVCVLPLMIPSAVFFTVCSLLNCVLDMTGAQTGLAEFTTERMCFL